jgi:type I restriction enzyme S subunit
MSWPMVALEELCEINVGRTPSRYEKEYWEGGIHPWVSISDMSRTKHVSVTKECFSERARIECNMKPVAPGTVLLSFKLSIGKVSIAQTELYTNEAIAALPVLDPKQLHSGYLAHALEALDFSEAGNRAVMGATLNKAGLKKVSIPLPPLDEQKRIVAILDQADALRRKRLRAIDRLNHLGQAIFHEMFGDPVTNDRGWPIRKLGDVGVLDRGISKHRPRNDPALLGGDHPLIQTGDVANADGYLRSFTSTYSDLGLKQSKKWPAGTLCITIAANIGKTAILEIEACFPDSVVGFTPGNETNAEYVQFWMSCIQKRLEEIAPQSAQKNINLAILRELPIPMPPNQRQSDFREAIREIERQKARLRKSADCAMNLFASLQHRAFRGEF